MELRNLTSDEVFQILREDHRQRAAFGDAFGCLSFDPDSSVEMYCDAMMWDSYTAESIGTFFNWLFQIEVDKEQWKFILHPVKKRRLGYVCDFIASQAMVTVDEPVRILGRECRPAGVFQQIRNELQRRKVNVDDLAPSTPLEPYFIDHFKEMYATMVSVGRGKIPEMHVSKPVYSISVRMAFIALLILVLCMIFEKFIDGAGCMMGFGAALLLIGYLGSFVGAAMKPSAVEFGDLTDFRQLCRQLAHKVA